METPFAVEKIDKEPGSELDYSLSWATWLGAETISTSLLTAPAGITLVSQSNTTTTVTFRLSGGSLNNDYELVNTITTDPSGQTARRVVIIHMVPVVRLATILIATAGAANANSYATLAEAKTYFSWRHYTDAWDDATDEKREAALLMACARLEQEDYVGVVVTETQALKWPRMKNDDGDLIRNYSISAVPQPMKNAQCEVVLSILQGGPTSSASGESGESLSEVNLGPIKLKYDSSAAVAETIAGLPTEAVRYLAGLRLWSVLA